MYSRKELDIIIPWLNEHKPGEWSSFSERGLRDGAPPEAVKAYKEYCKVQAWAKKHGAKI